MSLVDERIVKMVFDNASFESKISNTIGSLNKLDKTTNQVAQNSNSGFASLSEAFGKAEITATQAGFHIRDVWLKVASIFEYQIAGKIVDAGKKIANALSMEGISDGFREYELKMGSIQTIMAGTGETLATVNKYLEELNKYSDQTIYSFADMTNNIGKFTNAGVKLEDAVAAIKGIANEAAISGANANEASRAMYNFSQALSAGYVKLIDWKSIENANMATKSFKETLLEVASAVGTVKKEEDGMYKVLSSNAQGSTMKEAISGTKNFNDSLAYQWMTTEVLTKALKIYATDVRTLSAAEKEAYENELKALNLNEEQIKKFEELGIKATNAASEIKTFTMLIDTLKEAIGSGWAMTWQLLIGDFEQAKSLWTEVGEVVGGAIDKMSEARNEFLKGGLQTGWEKLTTVAGAAIPQADKFKDVLLEVGVASHKISKQQADAIESTEDLVKSFHDLQWVTGNMLIKSVDKYYYSLKDLSAEELKEKGYTEANVKELEHLSVQLKAGTLSADDFAASMNKLGGRENVIEGLRNAFNGLKDVVTPIREAFKEVFPAKTSLDLYKLTEGFKKFTERLKLADETADKIKRTAKGIFSIFSIAGKFISAFTKAIFPASEGLTKLGGDFLTVTADIGDFISGINDAITKNKTFEKAFEGISKAIRKVVDVLKNFNIGDVKEKLSSITNYFKSLNRDGDLSAVGDVFDKVTSTISKGLENVKNRLGALKPLVEGLKSLFDGLVSVIGFVFKSIGNAISGATSGEGNLLGLTGLINTLLSGGILYKLFSGVKSFSDLGSNISGLMESVSGALQSFSKKIDAENLLSVAKAVAVLAGSLFVVAMIDSDKLLGATAAISAMVTVMTGAMAALMKAVNSFSSTDVKKTFSLFGKDLFGTDVTKMFEMSATLKAVSKALVAMGSAVLMMAIGLKVVASAAESGHLWDSFAVVSLMLAELTGVVLLLGIFGKNGEVGAKNLKSVTTALVIMAGALAIVSKIVEGGNAWEALGIISIMLGELAGIALLMENFAKVKLGGMTGLISLTLALNVAILAVKQVSDALGEDGNHIWEALGVCSLILGALAGVAVLLANFGGGAALGGAGAVMAAAAILIVVQALKQVNDLLSGTDQHVWQSLGVIAAALGILAVGLLAMSGAIPGAAALIVASAGLVILSGSLKLLGSMKLSEIGKGLLAMGGSLLILAVGLTAMIVALPGAIALTVAAAGLTVLAGVLKILGKMSIKEIGKSLLMLFTTLLGLTAIVSVLSIASPLILAFGVALTVLGVSFMAAGVGMTLFSAGLQALMAVIPLGAQALEELGTVVGSLVLTAIETLCDAIGLIAEKIVEYTPQITEAVLSIVTIILNVLVTSIPQIADAGLKIVLGLLQAFTDNMPAIAQAGADLIIAFLTAISNEIPRIVDEGYKCAIALINGLADAIRNNNAELIEAVDNLMDAVIQAITQWLVKFTPLGLLMTENTKDGIMSGEIDVLDAMKNLIQHIIDKIKEFVGDFKAAAENLIAGFIEGFKSSWVGKAINEAKNLAQNVVNAFNSKQGLDEHSPSKKSEKSAIFFIQGFINGMKETAPKAIVAAKKMGGSISTALQSAVEAAAQAADGSLEITPVVTPVLDLTNLKTGANIANGLLAGRSLSIASQISADYAQNGRNSSTEMTKVADGVGIGGTTFIQNNYSPKELSRIDIYRDTRNLFAQAKGALS